MNADTAALVRRASLLWSRGTPDSAREAVRAARRAPGWSALDPDARAEAVAIAARAAPEPHTAIADLRDALAGCSRRAEARLREALAHLLLRLDPPAAAMEAESAATLARDHALPGVAERAGALADLLAERPPGGAVADPEARLLAAAAALAHTEPGPGIAAIEQAAEGLPNGLVEMCWPALGLALARSDLVRARAGPSPWLVLLPERREVWCSGERAVAFGRSKLLYRLFEAIAVRGDALDREGLFAAAWREPYRPPSGDDKLHVALGRMRDRLPPGFPGVEQSERGSYALHGRPGVLLHSGGEVRAPDAAVLGPPPASPTNLESAQNQFVGRPAELASIRSAFATGARVVLVHGPGGAGKTRLVQQYAHVEAASWPGGRWWCDLAEARDADAVLLALAAALDLPLSGRDPAGSLGRALAARGRALVLLDNADPVLDDALTLVAGWAEPAPDAAFALTSQRLPVEASATVIEVDRMPADDAVALFLARADEAGAGVPDADRSLDAIRGIVGRVDGIPLAVELAAARSDVLDPGGILARMGERFRLLARRDDTGRHGGLESAMAWSWSLLSDAERAALAQCAVFRGPFSVDAAEAVVELPDGAPWLVDVFVALARASLVQRTATAGTVRFRLLQSIQAYALGQGDPASVDAARQRFAAWMARRATALGSRCDGPDQAAVRKELLADWDNLLGAAEDAYEPDHAVAALLAADLVLRATGPLSLRIELLERARALAPPARVAPVEARRAHAFTAARQAREALAAGLAATESDDPAVRASGLLWAAHARIGAERTASEEALAWLDRATGDARESGDRVVLGMVLGTAAAVLGRTGEARARVEALHREAIAHLRQAGAEHRLGFELGRMAARLWAFGRPDEALKLFDESVAVTRRTGDRYLLRHPLTNHGNLLSWLGRFDEAQPRYQEAIALHQEVGDPFSAADARVNLGYMLLDRGAPDGALEPLFQALGTLREPTAAAQTAVVALTHIASVHQDSGRLSAAGEALADALSSAAPRNPWTPLARAALGSLQHERGDLEAARASYEDALHHLPQIAPVFVDRYRAQLGGVLAQLGRLDEGRAVLAATRGSMRAGGDVRGLDVVAAWYGVAHLTAGDPAGARQVLSEAERAPTGVALRLAIRVLAAAAHPEQDEQPG